MANTELRRRLGELAQQFVEGVVKAIQSAPIAEVASASVNGQGAARAVGRAAPVAARGSAGRGASAKKSAGAAPKAGGARAGAAAKAAAGGGAARARGRGRPRTLVRRPSGEIQALRDSILKYLRGATRPVGAAEIGKQVGVKTADLAFPMNQLRKQGLVLKQGERTQAVYSLSKGGAAKKGKKK